MPDTIHSQPVPPQRRGAGIERTSAEPSEDPISREHEQLATMLALMLLITFGGAFLLFLIFVSLGLFLWVLVMGAVIAAYAGLHYLAWGRSTNGATEIEDDQPLSSTTSTWPRELIERRSRRWD